VSAVSSARESAFTAETAVPHVSAFSLAELMIALVILGLGLLFIAAALPVGLEYTRKTVDLANADAAGEYALNFLEANLRTAGHQLYDANVAMAATSGPQASVRLDNIFRPREFDPTSAPPQYPRGRYQLKGKYEPLFKVRPLVMGNIRAGVLAGGITREIADDAELAVTTYLAALPFVPMTPSWEADGPFTAVTGLSLVANQALPGLARVYPPIEPVTVYSVGNFFNDAIDYHTYNSRYATLPSVRYDREREKAVDRRIGWTAFYRRIAYDEPGPGTPPAFELTGPSDDVLQDPLRYEILVIVTQRISVNHRFPRQDLTNVSLDTFERPADDAVAGIDRLVPMPWLVIFDRNAGSAPLPILDPAQNEYEDTTGDRTILQGFTDPPTLQFRCTVEVGRLLPVGSVFVPAFNDDYPQDGNTGALRARVSGFVPHAPHALPIYEVVERPDEQTIVVRNNGHYPWVASGNANDTQAWPVWIIPPAFVERDSNGQPVYERSSPILKVVRRTITLPEINR
jgi:type II secretory pathway pseudopilin PulG